VIDLDTKPFSLVKFKMTWQGPTPYTSVDPKTFNQTKAKGLIPGKLYTVDSIEATSSFSSVYLVEYPY